MKIVRSLAPIEASKPAVTMAIGFFDGVHLGHQRVIALCREQAAREHAETWVLTFDPHPLQVVQPARAPKLLTNLTARLDLLRAQGIDGCMVIPFTPEFSKLNPEEFLNHLISHIPDLRAVVIGDNWRFGRGASGNVDLLRKLSRNYNFHVTVAEPVLLNSEVVSSSRIREAVDAGRLADAEHMLGRRHALAGRVVDGMKRGRHLGFPTANLDLHGYALPPSGIYAALVHRDGHAAQAGAVYLPEGNAAQPGLLEVHLLDFAGDLYGHYLSVEFVQKIREDNLRFEREQDLKQQIANDVVAIRELLGALP
jgi:riboflavin kinase / FMN adenylyltransferase